MKMKRLESGLWVPDDTPEPAEPEKPKPTPASVLKLNHDQRRRLAKPWKARKWLRDMARRQAADDIKSGKGIPTRKRKRPRRHNGILES